MKHVIIGSRGSDLALQQANQVKDMLKTTYPELIIQIQTIRTQGDIDLEKSIEDLGGKAAFTSELEVAIINQTIDVAVHSLKDLPVKLPNDLMYLGSPVREDVRDVFVSNKWQKISEIPDNGMIATGSFRRKAQLLSLRPDLQIQGLRGNIDTRIKKLDNSDWDGIIIAAAAMHRLGLHDRISEYLDYADFVPASGQGALGLEIHVNREDLKEKLSNIIDHSVTSCCKAERLFLSQIDGGCFAPIGCFARLDEKLGFMITGYVASMDGKNELKKTVHGDIDKAENLALKLAEDMINDGALEVMSS